MTSAPRNRQCVRIFALVRSLKNGRQTLPQLAAELGVTTRTIRRDIEALIEAQVPVQRDGDVAVVWWIERSWTL